MMNLVFSDAEQNHADFSPEAEIRMRPLLLENLGREGGNSVERVAMRTLNVGQLAFQ